MLLSSNLIYDQTGNLQGMLSIKCFGHFAVRNVRFMGENLEITKRDRKQRLVLAVWCKGYSLGLESLSSCFHKAVFG